MKREIIAISDEGMISIPSKVRMTMNEIADLFGIFYQTTKKNIRAIEKSSVSMGDYSMGGTVEGERIFPDYYGLEMIIAVAFRVQSAKTKIFRSWIIKKALKQEVATASIFFLRDTMFN